MTLKRSLTRLLCLVLILFIPFLQECYCRGYGVAICIHNNQYKDSPFVICSYISCSLPLLSATSISQGMRALQGASTTTEYSEWSTDSPQVKVQCWRRGTVRRMCTWIRRKEGDAKKCSIFNQLSATSDCLTGWLTHTEIIFFLHLSYYMQRSTSNPEYTCPSAVWICHETFWQVILRDLRSIHFSYDIYFLQQHGV